MSVSAFSPLLAGLMNLTATTCDNGYMGTLTIYPPTGAPSILFGTLVDEGSNTCIARFDIVNSQQTYSFVVQYPNISFVEDPSHCSFDGYMQSDPIFKDGFGDGPCTFPQM